MDDLRSLQDFNEFLILKNIKERYERDLIYTTIADVLVSVNPNQDLNIYTPEIASKYQNASGKLCRCPHLYSLSVRMLQQLRNSEESQCCVVTGESGAGKTESFNRLVDHVLKLCWTEVDELLDRIPQVNPLLEAFGNAKTGINLNSTRFGEYLELNITTGNCITGACVHAYILEKSRVSQLKQQERNFHVFYYMYAGMTRDDLAKFLMDSPSFHRYLRYGESFIQDLAELNSWSKQYEDVLSCLHFIGFTQQEIDSIHVLMSAVLNIGDIDFVVEEREGDDLGVFVKSTDHLDKVASLLGVDSDDLEVALTVNFMKAPESQLKSLKSMEEAVYARDALAETVYTRFFSWLVMKINTFLAPVDGVKKSNRCLGFLDMYGFENLENNGLEQLFINVASEQLQFHFTQHIFAWEQLEYEQEGISCESVCYEDNRPIINLILEKPNGVLCLTDEESKSAQADEETLVSTLNAGCSHNDRYWLSSSHRAEFGIVHFAGRVVYSADNFLRSNRNSLDANLVECLRGSTEKLISTLFSSKVSKTGSLQLKSFTGSAAVNSRDLVEDVEKRKLRRMACERDSGSNKARRNMKLKEREKKILTSRKQKPAVTLGTEFRNSLMDVMEKVLACQPHFIKCFKANSHRRAHCFDDDLVLRQLRYSNIVETVKIRKQGYPVRFSFKDFIDRYKFLSFPMTKAVELSGDSCRKILDRCEFTGWKIGTTKVFLRFEHTDALDEKMNEEQSKVAIAQKVVRGHLARIDYDFIQSNRKQEERSVGNLLVSISTKNSKMVEGLRALDEVDVKREHQEKEGKHVRERDKENAKRKLTKTPSDPDGARSKETLRGKEGEDSPNRKLPKPKLRGASEPLLRVFAESSMSAWCRVDCYERQHHIASFHMDQAVVVVDGTQPVSDKHRIAFAALPSTSGDPKVTKVKNCIGKGVQLHCDEKQNLWATRLGKNPIFVRGYTLCPELVKLNGKLTQGVPMKVLDAASFKQNMRDECEASQDGVTEELKAKIYSRLKVCVSFIKDTVLDEETPCWFEVWLLKVKENVKRYLESVEKRRLNGDRRKSTISQAPTPRAVPNRSDEPLLQRSKSGDQLLRSSERRVRSQTALPLSDESAPLNAYSTQSRIPRPRPPSQNLDSVRSRVAYMEEAQRRPSRLVAPVDSYRREKSMDSRLEARLLEKASRNKKALADPKEAKVKKESPTLTPEQSLRPLKHPPNSSPAPNSNSNSSSNSMDTSEYLNVADSSRDETVANVEPSHASAVISTPIAEEALAGDVLPPSKRSMQGPPPTAGMSYRQVFGLQSSDYLFNVTPPNYTRHRRFSDSDTESLQNFIHKIIPQDDSKMKVLQQPKKWIRRVRRKSEDQPKRKAVLSSLRT